MSATTASTYHEDALYREAMSHFQKGEWEAGLGKLDQVIQAYPMDPDLRALRQEMRVRAHVDQDERVETGRIQRQRIRTMAVRVALVVVVVLLGVIIFRTYSVWLNERFTTARETLNEQMQEVELSVKFRDAQDYQRAGRLQEALALYIKVAEDDQNYPGLAESLEEVKKLVALEAQYSEAQQLIGQGDYPTALDLLRGIEDVDPYYKDVSILVTDLESKFILNELLSEAEEAYMAQDWEKAIEGYANLHTMDPQYQSSQVIDRLKTSYINSAKAILANENSTVEDLERADEYFRKALSLSPQSLEIKAEQSQAFRNAEGRMARGYYELAQSTLAGQESSLQAMKVAEDYFLKALALAPNDLKIETSLKMVRLFLQAQESFNRGKWDEVIELMEQVHSEMPDFALGTARQTLYEAYMSRGKLMASGGNYEAALSDYTRAAELAGEMVGSNFSLHQAQIQLANVHGNLGNYVDAVALYRNAAEIGKVRETSAAEDPVILTYLNQAEAAEEVGNYKQAYKLYRSALNTGIEKYDYTTHIVQPGDYLLMLAAKYHSTVEAIVQANSLKDPNLIIDGEELIIPIIP